MSTLPYQAARDADLKVKRMLDVRSTELFFFPITSRQYATGAAEWRNEVMSPLARTGEPMPYGA